MYENVILIVNVKQWISGVELDCDVHRHKERANEGKHPAERRMSPRHTWSGPSEHGKTHEHCR